MEDSEWFDPYCAEFPPEVTPVVRDLIFDSALTGLEAEAMIIKYGGDLFNPVESAPMATAHTASFFCDSVPSDSGLKLPPDFVRKFDRVALSDIDRNRRISSTFAKKFSVFEGMF